MMNKGAARRFDNTDTFFLQSAAIDQFFALDIIIIEQFLDFFSGVQHFHKAGVMIIQRTFNRFAACNLFKDSEKLGGFGRIDTIGDIKTSQGADPITAVRIAEFAEVGEFHIRPVFDSFGDLIEILFIGNLIEDDRAVFINAAQGAMIEFEFAIRADRAHITRIEGGERFKQVYILLIKIKAEIDPFNRPVDYGLRVFEQSIAVFRFHGSVHAAGNSAGGMNFLTAGSFNDFLAELAQLNSFQGCIRSDTGDADDIAQRGIGIKPE